MLSEWFLYFRGMCLRGEGVFCRLSFVVCRIYATTHNHQPSTLNSQLSTLNPHRLVLLDEEEERYASGDNSQDAAPCREAGVEGARLDTL